MRRALALALTVLALAAVGLSAPVAGHAPETPPQVDPSATVIEVDGTDDRLWPFTSRAESFEERTLVINAIVTEDPETARTLLGQNVADSWERTDPVRQPLGAQISLSQSQSPSRWRHAHGSVRYTYVETEGGEGQWIAQRYQLHVGTYLGSRHHIRAFAPDEASPWTALQAHSEYWDWFRLRHTVTDVRGTADILESAFRDSDVRTVERRHTRESGPLSEGIVVVVGALAPAIVGITTRQEWATIDEYLSRQTRRDQALVVFGLAAAIPLSIRAVGIGLEDVSPVLTPKLFVVLLYPCLAVGLPVVVAWYAADLPGWLAGPTAAVGLAVGFALEFVVLGLVPPDTILRHRLFAAAALGVLAAGGGRRRPLVALVGAALWCWGLLAPLLGLL